MKFVSENLEESRRKFDIVYSYVVRYGGISVPLNKEIHYRGSFPANYPHWFLRILKNVVVASAVETVKSNKIYNRSLYQKGTYVLWFDGEKIPSGYVDIYNHIKNKEWIKSIRR